MSSEFEAYVEAIAREIEETQTVQDSSNGPTSWYCDSPMLGKASKLGGGASLRSLRNGEAISYHGLV